MTAEDDHDMRDDMLKLSNARALWEIAAQLAEIKERTEEFLHYAEEGEAPINTTSAG